MKKFSPRLLIILLILLLQHSFLVAQNKKIIDSLELLIKTSRDTIKIRAINQLALQLKSSDRERAWILSMEGRKLADKIRDMEGIAASLNLQGMLLASKGNYSESIDSAIKALDIGKALSNNALQAVSLNSIGGAYNKKGDPVSALAYYFKALDLNEKANNLIGLKINYHNIGSVYYKQGNGTKALEYYHKSLAIAEKIADKRSQAQTLINIGNIYQNFKEYKMAEDAWMRSLELLKEESDNNSLAICFNNMGSLYLILMDYDKAYEYALQALRIAESSNLKDAAGYAKISIGEALTGLKNFALAEKYLKESTLIGKEIGAQEIIRESLRGISEVHLKKGDYKKAYEYYKKFTAIKDSVLNEKNSQIVLEMTTKYETKEKEKEIELLKNNEKIQQLVSAKQQSDLKRQRLISIGSSIGLLLLLILAVVLYNSYQVKRKANSKLETAYLQIEKSKRQITDSIDYARTIQEAILPLPKIFNQFFPEAFILYKPKAVVSGDFYWVGQKDNKIICAVADCTGHGVPGAFMSLLGNNLLENVIKKYDSINPSQILDSLNKGIVTPLKSKKENSSIKSGMDIALITIDKSGFKLEFAGAHNSIYIVRAGELTEIKADRMPVGFSQNNETICFTNNSWDLKKGDTIYLYTDGYPDQIGGENRKKFYYQPFRDLLLSINTLAMEKQKQKLDETIIAWQGKLVQTDDILVVGIRI